jgi:chloramphenicol 3-O-phosphotransferase
MIRKDRLLKMSLEEFIKLINVIYEKWMKIKIDCYTEWPTTPQWKCASGNSNENAINAEKKGLLFFVW